MTSPAIHAEKAFDKTQQFLILQKSSPIYWILTTYHRLTLWNKSAHFMNEEIEARK